MKFDSEIILTFFSVPFDWIRLFIYDANKCTFDMYKYSLIWLLHILV